MTPSAEADRRVTISELARELDAPLTTVSSWYHRGGHRNGFPPPGDDGLWRLGDVLAWRASYTPTFGGAPRGPANGRHREHVSAET